MKTVSLPLMSRSVDMGCQNELVQKITGLYHQISSLESLEPSKNVNKLFTQLVLTCIPPTHIDVTNLSNSIQEMRSNLIKLCGEAEGHLESHFSLILATYDNPLHHLTIFPYYSNYLKLAHLEFTILSQHLTHVPNQIAFVGSGPLPLTSIVLASNHLTQSSFHNYDIDPSANSMAFNLVSSDPDLSKRMFFHTTDILNVTNGLKEYDVVFLAALVGMNKEDKVKVIDHLGKYMAVGAVLMVRSAHDARAFLYPVVDPCDLKGFEVLSVYHPTDEVINSIVICQKYEQGMIGSMIMPSKCSEIEGFNPLNHGAMIEELAIEEKL